MERTEAEGDYRENFSRRNICHYIQALLDVK